MYSQLPDKISDKDLQKLKQVLKKEKKIQITIVSGSMEPLISIGGQYKVESIEDISQLKRFDIIVFHHQDFLICHLIWHLNSIKSFDGERVFITKGLANRGVDLPVAESKILGIVREPKISWWMKLKVALLSRFS